MRQLSTITKELLEILLKLEVGQSKEPAARLVVEARLDHFTRANGSVDYQGKSMAFRRWIGGVYDDLGLEGSERIKVASSLRYAIGNVLREVLTEDQLEEAGLLKSSPRERGKDSYDRVAALHNILLKNKIEDQEELELVKYAMGTLIPRLPATARKQILEDLQKNLNESEPQKKS